MTPRGKKRLKRVGIAVAVLVGGIQCWPVDRSNPPATAPFDGPTEVAAILRRACYDCHSNEVRWPWYSYVAPISWRVANHVHEGRAELNFSEWTAYPAGRRHKKRQQVWDEVQAGNMPLWDYLWMHGDARLSDADKAVLANWSRAED
jgi:hypothetical protein